MPEPITTEVTPPPNGATPPAEAPAQPGQPPTPEAPAQPVAKMFTQDQLNEIVAREKRQAREKALAEAKAPTPPQAAQAQPAATPLDAPVTRAEFEAMRLDNQYATVLIETGLKLNELQRSALRTHFNPNDRDSLIATAHEMFPHLKSTPPASAPASAPVAPPATPKGNGPSVQQAPGYVSPGGPSGSPDAGLESDPQTWTKDMVKAYEADGTFMARLERWKLTQPGGGGPGLFPNRAPKR